MCAGCIIYRKKDMNPILRCRSLCISIIVVSGMSTFAHGVTMPLQVLVAQRCAESGDFCSSPLGMPSICTPSAWFCQTQAHFDTDQCQLLLLCRMHSDRRHSSQALSHTHNAGNTLPESAPSGVSQWTSSPRATDNRNVLSRRSSNVHFFLNFCTSNTSDLR